jgi:hypothetical protein
VLSRGFVLVWGCLVGACAVELVTVARELEGRGVLVVEELRVNGQAVPMLSGARVAVSGRTRSAPLEVTFSLVPTSLEWWTVAPPDEGGDTDGGDTDGGRPFGRGGY